jgi:peptidoglycan/xylan/chitin deacetylase (PgdA/CDA1 family)
MGIKCFSLRRQLLDYLTPQNIKATFFVVGSRVVENPRVLIEEYMGGHEISVHTWSHHASIVSHTCVVPC